MLTKALEQLRTRILEQTSPERRETTRQNLQQAFSAADQLSHVRNEDQAFLPCVFTQCEPSTALPHLPSGVIATPVAARTAMILGAAGDGPETMACLDRLFLDLYRHGIQFVIWPRDPIAESDDASPPLSRLTRRLHDELGFEWIANLIYVARDPATPADPALRENGPMQFATVATHFALDFSSPGFCGDDSMLAFVRLVQQTYVDTWDCPRLANYRGAMEVLADYRSNHAFHPDYWYVALIDDQPVGCVLMTPIGEFNLELTYFGITPAARGKGWGSHLMQFARDLAMQQQRLLLAAVDESNLPALRLYLKHGFRSIQRESVWCANVPGTSEDSTASN
ncbi:MAG: GNAT family N-acetyltransferase [Planctomycetota bacterium]